LSWLGPSPRQSNFTQPLAPTHGNRHPGCVVFRFEVDHDPAVALSTRLLAFGLTLLLVLALGGFIGSQPGVENLTQAALRRVSATLARWRSTTTPPPASVTLVVEPARVIRPINPLIYGVAVAGPDELVALGARLNRWGGNPNTRYNWELGNAWNSAADFEFRNYGWGDTTGPASVSASDRFVAANRSVGVVSELTVPAIGWVARDGRSDTRSINVPASGGPPLGPFSESIDGYDPTDNRNRTSVASFAHKGAPFEDPPDLNDERVYQAEWVQHLVQRFGAAADGGVRYYAIDNEPDLWSSTHVDIHPVHPSYDDLLATFLEYALAIKAVDPGARILGPALSGWTSYFYSPRDVGDDRYRTHADRRAHGNMPFLAWWLDQVRAHDERVGIRFLDVVDVHYYPQAPGVFSPAHDDQTRALRLRSTRSLWDPTYIDESWIEEPVRLVPRLREWIDQYYPGTRLAIGEWNWGAEHDWSGALAVADVLGIFGREGVDMASYWLFPPLDSPAAHAFSMYTNYDGLGHGFGDRAIDVRSDASPDDVTGYASIDSATGDIVVMALNKRMDAAVASTIRVQKAPAASAHVFRFDPATSASIQDLGAVPLAGADVPIVLPPMSITLVRIGQSGAASGVA
jgi:hypothetical protein